MTFQEENGVQMRKVSLRLVNFLPLFSTPEDVEAIAFQSSR